MNINAKIKWVIDNDMLGIKSGTTENIAIDTAYVKANESDIEDWIENELYAKYGVSMTTSGRFSDIGDFVVTNMAEIIDDIKFDEFEDKTQYSNN